MYELGCGTRLPEDLITHDLVYDLGAIEQFIRSFDYLIASLGKEPAAALEIIPFKFCSI